MNATARREAYRAVLAGPGCEYAANIFDPLSARIAHELGFRLGTLPGSIASFTVLGAPDIAVLTLSELTEQARRIARAAEIPLQVDADHGYGNALSVMRTVEELEAAGVAALTIEDTLLPARFGAGAKAELISIEEGAGKMRAALAARSDPSLAVIGRTSAMSLSGTEDAVARIAAYAMAGVDAIFLSGVKSREQVEAAAAALRIPVIIGSAPRGLIDPAGAAGLGVRVMLQGHAPFMASVQAVYHTMKALRDGADPAEIGGQIPGEALRRLTRDAAYRGWMKDFLDGV